MSIKLSNLASLGTISSPFSARYSELKYFSLLLLIQQDSEPTLLTKGTWLPISDDPIDATPTEVLSTAACQVGLPGHVKTERALELFHIFDEVVLIATASAALAGGHCLHVTSLS